MDKTETPNLQRLAKEGVRAKRMIPSFPSKTFPNHYTIVTGLYPENHGIVSNRMFDPAINKSFVYKDSLNNTQGFWWGGEPIWATAVKQGQRSATYFWPGSEAEVAGARPTYYEAYNGKVPDSSRVDKVLQWLDLPAEKRPTLITLYFSHTDDIGHRHGPESKEILLAIRAMDAMVGRLCNGLDARGLFDKVNIIALADHGFASTSADSLIFLDDFIDMNSVQAIIESPVVGLRSEDGDDPKVFIQLANVHPHMKVYNRETMPARFHYTKNNRISPVTLLADEGWSITTRSYYSKFKNYEFGGTHGYDNELISMGALFVAHGPAFKKGYTAEPFQNIHVYELMAHILGLKPSPNDGSLEFTRNMLK
jgi:predicted AlkP superfamily pyrophosphatase or phosphodiesterase